MTTPTESVTALAREPRKPWLERFQERNRARRDAPGFSLVTYLAGRTLGVDHSASVIEADLSGEDLGAQIGVRGLALIVVVAAPVILVGRGILAVGRAAHRFWYGE